MNALEKLIHDKNLFPVKTMNLLTEGGIISDLCILPCDVADSDCARAIAYLEPEKMML